MGAGPSGSTAAYFMSQGGAKVALLEKEHFPRDKYCGDAVCTPAINILTEMGVMQELMENNEAHFADAGGFVSPAGLSYIGEQPCFTKLAQQALMRHLMGLALQPVLSTAMNSSCDGESPSFVLGVDRTDSLSIIVPPQ